MTAVGYVRVSTTEQVKGFGLDVQRSAIADYCDAQGLTLGAVYSDDGVSGSNGLESRDGLARALATLESRQAAVLVVYRLDRLARDLLLQETILGRLRACGVAVVSVTEGSVDSDDPTRVLVRQVLGAIGEYERALIRARVMAGKAAKAARGGYAGGRPAFGSRAAGAELVPDPSEQLTVERIRELRDQGSSLRSIARALEEEGRPAKAGRRWHASQVARVLAGGPSVAVVDRWARSRPGQGARTDRRST